MPNYNQRYAFVTSHPLEPRRGTGTAVVVRELLAALSARGKNVGVVTPSVTSRPTRMARWWFNRHVRRTLSELTADIVIGIDGDGYRYARGRRALPYVAYLPRVRADELPGEAGSSPLRPGTEADWEQVAARSADLVITPTVYGAECIRRAYDLPPDRVVVVPHGIDPTVWSLRALPTTDSPCVLTVAHLVRRKGLDILIQAWEHVQRTWPAARLRIVGGGPEQQALARSARALGDAGRRIEFVGTLSHEGVRTEMIACDLFCLPARRAAASMAVLEALATGRPVVATAVGALPELVGSAGLLVSPDHPEELALAIAGLLEAPDERRRLAKAGRDRAEVCTWAASAQEFGHHLALL